MTFDAVVAGRARGCDVVIADTAGRLATQSHLMEELKKIQRTIAKAEPGAPHEVLLVIDGNTGQNALAQVQAFDAALELTGLSSPSSTARPRAACWRRSRSGRARAAAPAAGVLHRRRREARRPADLSRARVRAGPARLSVRRSALLGRRQHRR